MFESLKNIKGMKLIPEGIEIPALYSQENEGDPICHVKLFALSSNWTWYVIEYDPESKICFGFVSGFENELGTFSIEELESLGANIERDLYFSPAPLSEIKELHGRSVYGWG